VILIFIIPFLTMRLIARRSGKRQSNCSYTTPITPFEIVLGKYLACLAITGTRARSDADLSAAGAVQRR